MKNKALLCIAIVLFAANGCTEKKSVRQEIVEAKIGFGELEIAALEELLNDTIGLHQDIDQDSSSFTKLIVKRGREYRNGHEITWDPYPIWLNQKLLKMAISGHLFEEVDTKIRLRIPNEIMDPFFEYFIEIDRYGSSENSCNIVPLMRIWRFDASTMVNPISTDAETPGWDDLDHDDVIELAGIENGDIVKVRVYRSKKSSVSGKVIDMETFDKLLAEDAKRKFDIQQELCILLPVVIFKRSQAPLPE